MKKRRDIGVRATLRCPRCGHEYETTVSAGTGIKPGQVIDTEHLPGMCIDAYDGTPPDDWPDESEAVHGF